MAPASMTYTINPDGSVDLGYRTIPVPGTISPEAQAMLRSLASRPAPDGSALWERRAELDAAMKALDRHALTRYAVDVQAVDIAGVACHIVRPEAPASDRVLLNLHGGGFVIGGGTLTEAIPVAAHSGTTVIAVDYRLAPEHRYPAAVDDVEAVYRAVLERHAPDQIGIYGQSAGGFLTGQAIRRLQREQLPLPACIGIFGAGGDLSDLGDTAEIFDLGGFSGDRLEPFGARTNCNSLYLDGVEPTDPDASPEFGDLSGFPPTLLIVGTRDATLSAGAKMHRALRRADVIAELYVFEAMAHGFFYAVDLPESREAFDVMARFFRSHLASQGSA
jgi:epsilon-lactone hydrolase